MEFVNGDSLDKLPNVTRDETLLMARQISMVVSYLHDQNITHRDIKPANIIVTNRGRGFSCKLVDYGESSDESNMKTFSGTPMYRAPEIVEMDSRLVGNAETKGPSRMYSNAVDVWSMGILFTEYFYTWLTRCLNELTDTPRDSWLADTEGPGVPGVDSFQRNMFRNLALTPSRKEKWYQFIRGRLEEEHKEGCSMAAILLRMVQDDPLKRAPVSECRYYLDHLDLSW